MNPVRHTSNLLFFLLSIICIVPTNQANFSIIPENEDFCFYFFGAFKTDFLYGKNMSLLNHCNDADQILYFRHSLDLKLDAAYGKKTYDHSIICSRFGIRNKGIWGNPRSISQTTLTELKASETRFGEHNHFIPRHIFWIREAWMEFDINEVFRLYTLTPHKLKIGAFSFELGRGIALGDAYAVGPEILGFYTDDAVDQYAFGAKLSGEIKYNLCYDLYAAILDNKSSTVRDTSARIYGQEYGRQANPIRGFGKINYVVAGHLKWNACKTENILLCVEPYWLFNDQPEQKIEFLGDASSILGALGLACEFVGDRFEFGFDTAINLGHQSVKGWDRNVIELRNIDSFIIESNTKVLNRNPNDLQNGEKIPYIPNGTAQRIIEGATRNESENGKLIGIVDTNVGNLQAPVYITNAEDRFRNPYTNKYNGWMFVTDASLWNCGHDLEAAITFGYASGDNNPNEDTLDRVYSGFIGLQELYSGKRVKSAFVLGSLGRLRRPLSLPFTRKLSRPTRRFVSAVSRFTNLVFTGGAIHWEPHWFERKLSFWPNLIFYWQDFPTKRFNLETRTESNAFASKFLGTEFSLFIDYFLLKSLRFFVVVGIFIPGTHFTDIKGKPISPDQVRELDRLDRTGFLRERVPNISDDTAATLNLGFEYKF